ncbi:MAG: hypothetical protein JO347_10050 [Candidatus Eremiobacteraeota bacterium]|nr:hypothetical protein [Candidatus Eremiobacteraeota bacterium]MBV8282387.1 hypothetical protein [Candidatus Eremiobacteraeota bacterium]
MVAPARASSLDGWFVTATQFNALTSASAAARPDFLGGTSLRRQCQFSYNGNLPKLQNGIWQLVRYDRTHQIGLAMATTDQNSCAIFKAHPPSASAPDADLSNYATGTGLKIGSPYSKVLAAYGGQAKHGHRFTTAYIADVANVTAMGKPVKLPETITIVIDDGVVSAITISVDEAGMY